MSIPRLTLTLIMALLATSIKAETINCTAITSLPATITAQGIYCLTGKLGTAQTSGVAITINANNVTLDLNGWKVDGGAAGTSTTEIGIFSEANNVTIKNGIVRGFFAGIYLNGSGDVVQDVLLDTNYYLGIWTTGPGALVEHNQVVNSGYTTTGNTFGILSTGTGATISDNIVSGVTSGGGEEVGIGVNAANSTVRNNVVSNTTLPSAGVTSYGIYNYAGNIVLNNT
ncbi:MAG: hypothetical protein ACRETA_14045, partial [Gammaproteobacteria bacterium]